MGAPLYPRFATAKTVLARRLGEKFRLADYTTSTDGKAVTQFKRKSLTINS
jgi:hypothetical protein